MSNTRISVEVPDADSCTYNSNYFRLLILCIYYHGSDLKKYGQKKELEPDEKSKVAELIREIKEKCKEYAIYDKEDANDRKHFNEIKV